MVDKSKNFDDLREALEKIYSQKPEPSGSRVYKKVDIQPHCEPATKPEEVQTVDLFPEAQNCTKDETIRTKTNLEGVIPVPPPLPDLTRPMKVVKSMKTDNSTKNVVEQNKTAPKEPSKSIILGEKVALQRNLKAMMSLPPPPTQEAIIHGLAALKKVPPSAPCTFTINMKASSMKKVLYSNPAPADTKRFPCEKAKSEGVNKNSMLKGVTKRPVTVNPKFEFPKVRLREISLFQNDAEQSVRNSYRQHELPDPSDNDMTQTLYNVADESLCAEDPKVEEVIPTTNRITTKIPELPESSDRNIAEETIKDVSADENLTKEVSMLKKVPLQSNNPISTLPNEEEVF